MWDTSSLNKGTVGCSSVAIVAMLRVIELEQKVSGGEGDRGRRSCDGCRQISMRGPRC